MMRTVCITWTRGCVADVAGHTEVAQAIHRIEVRAVEQRDPIRRGPRLFSFVRFSITANLGYVLRHCAFANANGLIIRP